MTLYILNYNNYYNRLVKKEDTLEAYQEYIIYEQTVSNFNPNTGLETSHIFGTTDYNGEGDYMLVVNEYNEIVSRWFILTSTRTRAGQWSLNFKRDVVADYYNIIVNSPIYVEKGYVGNNDPLVYNSENVSFNQIKKGEYLLKNELETPWIVAYLSRFHTDTENGNQHVYNTFEGNFKLEPKDADYEFEDLSEYQYSKYTKTTPYIYTDDIKFFIYHKSSADGYGSPASVYRFELTSSGTSNTYSDTSTSSYIYSDVRYPAFASISQATAAYKECYNKYITYDTIDPDSGLANNSYTHIGNFDGYKTLFNESGKVIKVKDDYYMVVAVSANDIYSFDNKVNLGSATGTFGEFVFNKLVNPSTAKWSTPISNPNKNAYIEIPYTKPGIYLTFKKLDKGNVTYNFSYSHNVTMQTPYEIIAAPLNSMELTYYTTSGGQTVKKTIQHNGDIALQWFLDLGEKHAAGLVYDIQIVPYCPIYTTDLEGYGVAGCYFSDDANAPLALAIKIPEASFTRLYDTPKDLPIDNDYKISNTCDLYRICSPNGMGDFDFSIAKNRGALGFEVDCTLMPYNPYIKINPVFNKGGLYGGDYNDYRGLICKGEFSLPITTDQWETYELQNKNYQAIFDRETTTLEIQNDWAKGEAWVNLFTGVGSGAVAGAVGGSMVQPGVGTVAGAVVGGVTSAVGGAADLIKTYQLQDEMMAARHDQFQLNLQTIRARPNTLSRTTTYNINNKYFPYIEYYTCTEMEREIFKRKIRYEGMTVSAIGYLELYLNPDDITFFKGRIIRLEGTTENYLIAQTIVNEINQGVYI